MLHFLPIVLLASLAPFGISNIVEKVSLSRILYFTILVRVANG